MKSKCDTCIHHPICDERRAVGNNLSNKECMYANDYYINRIEHKRLVAQSKRKGKWQVTEGYPHRLYCGKCYNINIYNIEIIKDNIYPSYCMWCGTKMERKGRVR